MNYSMQSCLIRSGRRRCWWNNGAGNTIPLGRTAAWATGRRHRKHGRRTTSKWGLLVRLYVLQNFGYKWHHNWGQVTRGLTPLNESNNNARLGVRRKGKNMARKANVEKVIRTLREVEVLQGQGKTIAEAGLSCIFTPRGFCSCNNLLSS